MYTNTIGAQHDLPPKGIQAGLHAAVRQCDSQQAAVGQ